MTASALSSYFDWASKELQMKQCGKVVLEFEVYENQIVNVKQTSLNEVRFRLDKSISG